MILKNKNVLKIILIHHIWEWLRRFWWTDLLIFQLEYVLTFKCWIIGQIYCSCEVHHSRRIRKIARHRIGRTAEKNVKRRLKRRPEWKKKEGEEAKEDNKVVINKVATPMIRFLLNLNSTKIATPMIRFLFNLNSSKVATPMIRFLLNFNSSKVATPMIWLLFNLNSS